jgi:DNA-directed RNA polymerase specialized sigma24 family protein
MNRIMYFHDKAVQEWLARQVARFTADNELRKDLLQEALFQLWLTRSQLPGQTKAQCLGKSLGHARNYLRKGRSVDSEKRRHGACQLNGDEWQPAAWNGYSHGPTDSFLGTLCRNDFLEQLSSRLKPQTQSVLCLLSKGYEAHEIAGKMGCTARYVRRLIAAIAQEGRRLEAFAPLLPQPSPHA